MSSKPVPEGHYAKLPNGHRIHYLDVGKGRVADVRYRLLPVYSELLKPDPAMQALIDQTQQPQVATWSEKLATSDRLLYRRGNFEGATDDLICAALRRELDAEIALSPGFRWGPTLLAGQSILMEDVLAQTAITYPETYVQRMTGAQIKDVLEDVCDNLFNADPYLQQGGDMVRTGGLSYRCAPSEAIGRRISDLTLDDGHPLDARKSYKVAGWASMNAQDGKPVWDVVANHLRNGQLVLAGTNKVTLSGVDGNPGFASQS